MALGGAEDEGSRESYCFFQIERVPSKERLRRIEHEVFSLLKAVFLAVDDFKDMGRACRELVPRLRSRRGEAGELPAARAFLEWLLDDNYIFMGTVSYGVGPDGTLVRVDETANGVFTDPTLLPVVFPGVVEHVEAHLHPQPSDDRVLDLDFCANASAIYHLEPIEDLTVREWGEDGKLQGVTLLLGRFARGAFAQRADRIPILKEKEERLLERCGAIPSSHVWRETRATFNHFPKTDLFYAGTADLERIIQRIVHVASDDEIVVEGRKGAGYEALYVAFSRLRYAYQIEAALRRAFASAFGPVAFGTSVDCGPVTLLIFYFDSSQLEHPVDLEEAAPADRAAGDRLGGPGRGRPREGVRRARGAAALPPLRHAGVAKRALPGGDGAGTGSERPPAARGAREPARGRRRREDRGDGLRAAVHDTRAGPHRHPEDPAEPRPHRHRGAAHPAHAARGAPLPSLPLRRRRPRPTASPPCARGSSASWTPSGPSTRSGRPTTR